MRARRFLQKTRRNLDVKEIDTIGFDRTKVECDNCHIRGHFARECRAPKHQDNKNREAPKRTVPAKDGPTNFALMAYTSSSSSRFDSETKTGLRYNSQGFDSQVLENQVNDKYNTCEGYHAVPPPYPGNFMPPKPNLVFACKHVVSKSVTSLPGIAKIKVKTSESKPKTDFKLTLEKFESSSKNLRWLLDSQQCDKTKTGLRYDSQGFDSQVLENQGNPQQELQERGVIDSGCSRHMTRNMSYLSEYEEINGGYVAFGGDLKEGKITGEDTECVVLSSNFKLLDESQVLLRVPRQNNMYSVDLRNVAPSGGLTLQRPRRNPALSFMRPFGCPVTILNTLDHLGPKSLKDEVADDARIKSIEVLRNENGVQNLAKEGDKNDQQKDEKKDVAGSTYVYLGGSIPVNVATLPNDDLPIDPLMPDLKDTANTKIFSVAYDDEVEGAEAHFNNLELTIVVSLIPITRIRKDHPKEKIIGDPLSALQTRRMTKASQEHVMVTYINKNKKDERGIVIRNKARLVAQGYTQDEGIDYDEVFAPGARIDAIRLFLAYAPFIGFIMYQMDVKNAFMHDTIKEEVYVCQPPGFEDLHFPNKDKDDIQLVQVYVDDIIFGSTKKSLCIEFEGLMHKKFQMSSMGELTFFLRLQTASTPIETNKALLKDKEAVDVDVYLYISMIRSMMYLTASRPDIMFAIYACARFQVTPKVSHLHAVKRIFRYLKGQPKLVLWYLRDSLFDLEAFSDNDYARASPDRKSTTEGC
nr:hypothetical protein [Tanacetum cinerariifolium]